MPSRVDVWDPTPEGEWIVENLRQSALDVRAIDLPDVPLTRADLLLIAGDVAGALGALKLLRDEGEQGDVPVVLLGIPEGMTHKGDGPGLGAEAVFRRPVEFAPLLARVFRLLETSARAEVSRVQLPVPERTMELSDPDDPSSSQVLLRPAEPAEERAAWRPREPTQELGDAPEPAEVSGEVSRVSGRPARPSDAPPTTSSRRAREPRSGASPISSYPGTGSVPGSEPSLPGPGLEIPPERRATLSPWLTELLRAADRRVFPDRPAMAVHLPAADEPPEQLVPAELFEVPSVSLDEPMIEDPIDAFTYVGGPAVPPPIHGATGEEEGAPASEERSLGSLPSAVVVPSIRRAASRVEPHVEVTTRTELPPLETSARARGGDWPDDDTVLGRSTPEGDRRGSLGPGGALRLLWRVAAHGLDTIAELHLDDGATVRLTFLGGTLRGFDGPIASTVLDGLRRRGRATERPADEAGAEAALQKRVDAGLLGRFERDRLIREARERLLVRVVGAERAEFVLRRMDDTQPGRVLARSRLMRRPIRAALVEVAREALDASRVAALLGPESPGLALGPDREAALAPAELTSELIELVVRLDGHRLEDFLAAAPTEPGLAGILYALVAGDALVLTDPPEVPLAQARTAVVDLIEAAAARALDGDYFTILGVDPGAGRGELERAHRDRRTELAAIPLEALGLEHLLDARTGAVEALDEALHVLSDAERRRRYASALRPVLS